MLGTPDGYNTETSERLHIDFAKMGYKASNRVNAIKQMAMYIQRLEALAMHEEYLDEIGSIANRAQILAEINEANAEELENDDAWEDEEEEEEDIDNLNDAKVRTELAIRLDEFLGDTQKHIGGRWEKEELADQGPERWHSHPELVVAKTPTDARIKLSTLAQRNDAPRLLPTLTKFLKTTQPAFKDQIPALVTSETKVHSWSRARLFHSPPPFKPSEGPHIDVVRAQPTKFDRFNRVSRPAQFDTVLILDKERRGGIHRYTAARVRAIFELQQGHHYLCAEKLAYVDKFYSPSQVPEADVGLYTVTRALHDGVRVSAVVPLASIKMTCHLAPRYRLFRPVTPLIQYSDVLQLCHTISSMNCFDIGARQAALVNTIGRFAGICVPDSNNVPRLVQYPRSYNTSTLMIPHSYDTTSFFDTPFSYDTPNSTIPPILMAPSNSYVTCRLDWPRLPSVRALGVQPLKSSHGSLTVSGLCEAVEQ
ncbi:hypothetical protein FRC07_014823 [Ceratobasidium sp. 392]|nr:hypothetical protein FRC07_014823 [Ceratobasidium sp. 392]